MKKAKKFAEGGLNRMVVQPGGTIPPFNDTPMTTPYPKDFPVFPGGGGGGGGGAYGGLDTVNQGGRQIGESLATISSGLGAPGRGPQFAFKKGGAVGSASKRADGIATKGKTKGRMV